MVLVIIKHVQTVHAAALLRLLGHAFGRSLAVTSCSGHAALLLVGCAAVRVVLCLAIAPGRLQTRVWWLQVSHGQHALDGLLCAGGCRWLTVSPSMRNTQHTRTLLPSVSGNEKRFRILGSESGDGKQRGWRCTVKGEVCNFCTTSESDRFPRQIVPNRHCRVGWSKCFYLQLKIKTTKSYLWMKQYIQAKLFNHMNNELIHHEVNVFPL